jgi:hypothetical protein
MTQYNNKFGGLGLRYNPTKSSYVGLPVDAFKDTASFLQSRYDSGVLGSDLLEDAYEGMTALDFEGDQAKMAEIKEKYGNKMEEYAQRGDYENMGRLISKDARGFTREKNVLDKRSKSYSAQVSAIEDAENTSRETKNRALSYLQSINSTGTGEDLGDIKSYNIAADVDMTAKADEIIEGWKADKTVKIDKKAGTVWFKNTNEVIPLGDLYKHAYKYLMNDPEVRSHVQQQMLFDTHGREDFSLDPFTGMLNSQDGGATRARLAKELGVAIDQVPQEQVDQAIMEDLHSQNPDASDEDLYREMYGSKLYHDASLLAADKNSYKNKDKTFKFVPKHLLNTTNPNSEAHFVDRTEEQVVSMEGAVSGRDIRSTVSDKRQSIEDTHTSLLKSVAEALSVDGQNITVEQLLEDPKYSLENISKMESLPGMDSEYLEKQKRKISAAQVQMDVLNQREEYLDKALVDSDALTPDEYNLYQLQKDQTLTTVEGVDTALKSVGFTNMENRITGLFGEQRTPFGYKEGSTSEFKALALYMMKVGALDDVISPEDRKETDYLQATINLEKYKSSYGRAWGDIVDRVYDFKRLEGKAKSAYQEIYKSDKPSVSTTSTQQFPGGKKVQEAADEYFSTPMALANLNLYTADSGEPKTFEEILKELGVSMGAGKKGINSMVTVDPVRITQDALIDGKRAYVVRLNSEFGAKQVEVKILTSEVQNLSIQRSEASDKFKTNEVFNRGRRYGLQNYKVPTMDKNLEIIIDYTTGGGTYNGRVYESERFMTLLETQVKNGRIKF